MKLFSNKYIARSALGKYIVLSACVMHFYWAILLFISPTSALATPVSVLVTILEGSVPLTIIVLLIVAMLALSFIVIRQNKIVSVNMFSVFLLPQLVVLFLSAERGLVAGWQGKYADGTVCPWAHILVDQSAILIMTFMYLMAIIEVSKSKVEIKSGS